VSKARTHAAESPSPLRGGVRGGGRAVELYVGPPTPALPRKGGGGALDYRLEEQIGFVLRRAHQRASGIFNAVMGEFGITPTQFAALAKLHDLGAVSQNELGRLTAMDPATIWGVAGRLIKRGYVAQSVDANDARLVILELTEAGRTATLAMKEVAAEVSQRTLEPLSGAEAATFLALLQRLG
jgi:DNA-binding MarR family transcriptional regulator